MKTSSYPFTVCYDPMFGNHCLSMIEACDMSLTEREIYERNMRETKEKNQKKSRTTQSERDPCISCENKWVDQNHSDVLFPLSDTSRTVKCTRASVRNYKSGNVPIVEMPEYLLFSIQISCIFFRMKELREARLWFGDVWCSVVHLEEMTWWNGSSYPFVRPSVSPSVNNLHFLLLVLQFSTYSFKTCWDTRHQSAKSLEPDFSISGHVTHKSGTNFKT